MLHWRVESASIGAKTCRNLVWRAVLYEYASQLLVAPVWSGGVLSQLSGTAAYLADRYIQRLSAIHRHTACRIDRVIAVAVDHNGSAVTH